MKATGPTGSLLEFGRAAHRLPKSAETAARRLLADTLAVGAAGVSAPGREGVLAAARNWGQSPEARVISSRERLPAPAAAFVNGFQIHALEWDAVHEEAVVHAMSVVTAALAASIDRRGGCSDEEALTALAVGVDIACGLGIAARSPLTFFRPATAGLIGAAIAVARIEGISAIDDVVGLAYSQCAGTMQAHVEGSIALPLQIGLAARAAITAADLVRSGLSGPHDALEGQYGYFALFDEGSLDDYVAGLGNRWRIEEISTKPYPCGRASHAILAGLHDLLRSHCIDPSEIISIDCSGPPLIHRLVGRVPMPDMSSSYARLCLPFLAALMIEEGRIDPRSFTPARFSAPETLKLASKVHVQVDGNPDPNALSPQRLAVSAGKDDIVEVEIPSTLGSPECPMTPDQAAAKRDLARELSGLATGDAEELLFDDPCRYFSSSPAS